MSSTTDSAAAAGAKSPGPTGFDYQPRTRVIYGAGTFSQLGAVAAEVADGHVLLVTDPGLKQAGHSDVAIRLLEASGLSVTVFDEVSPNPTTIDVDRCLASIEGNPIQLIIGLGGGSSMDCAKGANFLLTNGGRMQDYKGIGKATRPMLPMIAVPTTAGTGSEAQSFAVIADPETHMKMPCGDPKAACRVAILDPELTVTMPRSVCAATGVDAMTHAVESFVTKKRNVMSQMFARQAWQLLAASFPVVMNEPLNVAARGNMQMGAHLAGAAIENSMLGAAHATANPLSAHFGLVHGVAVGTMLPHVIRWNTPVVGDLYRDLAISAGWAGRNDTAAEAAEALAEGVTGLLRIAEMPLTLSAALNRPLDRAMLATLAREAAQQWTGTFNPREMDADAFVKLYQNAM